jgi:tetratricopeptide (TPR) repeat protein
MTLSLFLGASSATAAAVPAACRPNAAGRVDFQACVDTAEKDSPERKLALINLATQAFLRMDYVTAVRLYDEAQPPGSTLKTYSDANFHAFRAAAYAHVGRDAEALENAQTVLQIMSGKFPNMPPEARAADPEVLYENILPILKKGRDPAYGPTLAAYRALPARDWISYSNRAGILAELGDTSGALAANAEAMKLQPGHPAPLNNACYILAGAGRAAEGLPYCEQAVAAAPDIAPIHDSYAAALAALGRCSEANTQLGIARTLDPASIEYKRTLSCTAR